MDKLSEFEIDILNQNLLRDFLPLLVREMLSRNLINIERKEDSDYLWDVVLKHDYLTQEISFSIRIHDEFIQQSKISIKRKDYFVAIILLATAIEHILNLYFVERLHLQKISGSEIREVIRKTNLDAKTGWLLSIIGEIEIPQKLRQNIMKIVELRNSIVHYKPLLSTIDEKGVYGNLTNEIRKLNFDQFQKCPGELESLLQHELNKIDSNRILAAEITQKMFSNSPKIPARILKKARNKIKHN